MRTRRITLTILVAALLLASCASQSPDVATLSSGAGGPRERQNVDEPRDDEARVMAFAQCLRDQGIEVLDPQVDADGNVLKPELAPNADADIDKERWQEAFEVCDELIEAVSWAEKRTDRAEELEYWTGVAACLIEKEYDIYEPTAENLDAWFADLKSQINWDSPRQLADWDDCAGGGKSGDK